MNVTLMRWLLDMPKRTTLTSIRIYQRTFSPDHGPLRRLYPHGYCKFHPTCSQYTYEAVEKLGIIRGLWLGGLRVLRCNPWSRGGHDPIPGKK